MPKHEPDHQLVLLGELGLPPIDDGAKRRQRERLLAAMDRDPTATVRERSRRPARRAVMAVAAVAVMGSGTAFAAATLWSPTIGDDDRGHPTVADASIPTTQSDALGVLRRPQTDLDRGPQTQRMLKLLAAREVGGVHVADIRLLNDDGKTADILVPLQRVGNDDAGAPPGRRENVLCLVAFEAPSASTVCGSIQDLYAGRISYGLPAEGLVPDGVAKVEAQVQGGSVITAAVANNLYRFGPDVAPVPGSLRWLDANGNPVAKQ